MSTAKYTVKSANFIFNPPFWNLKNKFKRTITTIRHILFFAIFFYTRVRRNLPKRDYLRMLYIRIRKHLPALRLKGSASRRLVNINGLQYKSHDYILLHRMDFTKKKTIATFNKNQEQRKTISF